MDLIEYQGKQEFARFGIPVSPGGVADSVDEAVARADEAGYPVVVKAQVQVGGRGKAGGIKLANDAAEVRNAIAARSTTSSAGVGAKAARKGGRRTLVIRAIAATGGGLCAQTSVPLAEAYSRAALASPRRAARQIVSAAAPRSSTASPVR